MNIYVYSDESGVFDSKNNDYFVFGGIIFLSKESHEIWKRKYLSAERTIRKSEELSKEVEVKATNVSNKSKGKLYRSLNHTEKFGIVVREKEIQQSIFNDKKTKQRYLDFAFKIGVKRKLENLIQRGLLNPQDVDNIYFYVDEHTTATDGRYELREGLEQEFKRGTYNWNWNKFFPPLFPTVKSIDVKYCNSKKKTLIRSADIIANKLYFCARHNCLDNMIKEETNIIILPTYTI